MIDHGMDKCGFKGHALGNSIMVSQCIKHEDHALKIYNATTMPNRSTFRGAKSLIMILSPLKKDLLRNE